MLKNSTTDRINSIDKNLENRIETFDFFVNFEFIFEFCVNFESMVD